LENYGEANCIEFKVSDSSSIKIMRRWRWI